MTTKVNGIMTPYDSCIVTPPAEGGGKGVSDVGGVTIPDGVKGTSGQMPEVSGVTLADDSGPGTKRPSGMAGS